MKNVLFNIFKSNYRVLNSKININSIIRRQLSSEYVERMRLQQRLKNSGEFTQSQYQTGLYLIYIRKGGLIMISNQMNKLQYANYQGIDEISKNVTNEAIFMNIDQSEFCRFAYEFPYLADEQQKQIENKFNSSFVQLRQSLFLLSSQESTLVSQGKSLLRWKRSKNFCPECGSEMESVNGWSHKICKSCSVPQYPQMSPVSIVLVDDDKHENILLVRQPRHPPGMFSCLAGFLDLGENVEDCVAREIAEEVGLDVKNIKYLLSQHWPYPAPRLMLGSIATALPGQIDIDKDELEDAQWFNQETIIEAFNHKSNKLWLPPPGALAHHLIKWWLNKYHL